MQRYVILSKELMREENAWMIATSMATCADVSKAVHCRVPDPAPAKGVDHRTRPKTTE